MNISEVSKLTGISPDTLRYYEKIDLIKDIERTVGGKRNYSEADLNHINFINCMKKAGCTLEIIKKYMTLYDLGSKTVPERVNLLETQKKALIEAIEKLQESIDYLDYKIEHTKKH